MKPYGHPTLGCVGTLGGAVFTALVVLWLTAAGWFFATSGLTF